MGKLETQEKKLVRRTEIQTAILNTVATAGVLSIGLLAPGVIGTLNKLGLTPKSRQDEVIKSAASRLTKKGLLRWDGRGYSLTEIGEKTLALWEIENYKIDAPAKWDKKWRIIIFDIPEKKRSRRREIRRIFTNAGLYRLQDSVWVYPHDCEDIIGLLKNELGIGHDVLYIVADQIENDKHLRQYFSLAN